MHPNNKDATKVIVRQLTLVDTIDESEAISRLRVVHNAYLKAHQQPFGSFGGAGRAIFSTPEQTLLDKGRSAFSSFYANFYTTSDEAVVYGPAPTFENVFSPGNELMKFWEALAGVARITSVKKGIKKGISGYEIS